jgi:hypothetical protein
MVLIFFPSQKLAWHHVDIEEGRKAKSAKAGWIVGSEIHNIFPENMQCCSKVTVIV